MALSDLFAFLDPTKEKAFHRNPDRSRQPLLDGLEQARQQYLAGEGDSDGRWWVENNGVVAFAPTLHGTPLVVNGQTTNFIDADRFTDFIRAFQAEVKEGAFDDAIEAIEQGAGNAGTSTAVPV